MPNRMEFARMVHDGSCRPRSPEGTSVSVDCSNLSMIIVGEGANVAGASLSQCCQAVLSVGDVENGTVRQSCGSAGLAGPAGPEGAAAIPGGVAGKTQAAGNGSKADSDNGGSCQLKRILR